MAAKSRKGLGKGLGALFTDTATDTEIPSVDILEDIAHASDPKANEKAVVSLKLIDIEPNKDQPRKAFDADKLTALSDSIAAHGVVQPILVTPTKHHTYKIIAGERRWRAAKQAGLKEMPCIIRDFEEKEVMEIALVENLQREDLNPIEEAEGYRQLMESFDLTQEEVGLRVGKSRSAIANALRLNNLSDEIKQMVIDEKISQGHARALLSIESPEIQLEVANQIIKESLNVRQVEALVANIGKERPTREKTTADTMLQKYLKNIETDLSSRFGTRVKIHDGTKKGRIEFEYYSKDDLERILFELKKL